MSQQLLLGSALAVARIEAVVDTVDGEVCCRGPQIAIAWSRGASGLNVDSPQTPPTGIEFLYGR